jgi:hypothetical protein
VSVLQLQTAMARLLTSAEFREQVRRDGGESLRAYELTEAEHRGLVALLEGRLGTYAGCVSAGKEDFLLANLPTLVRERVPEALLRPSLRRFIEARPGVMLHPRDAGLAAVLRWLEEDVPNWPAGAPADARDVLRFGRMSHEVSAAQPRYPHPSGTPVPARLRRHPGWDAERFSHDVPAGRGSDVSWTFRRERGAAGPEDEPCHAVLADLARAFDQAAEVERVVAEVATKHERDERLGPDVPAAVRELVGELFAEGSLRAE